MGWEVGYQKNIVMLPNDIPPVSLQGLHGLVDLLEGVGGYSYQAGKGGVQVDDEINAGQEHKQHHKFKNKLDQVLFGVHEIQTINSGHQPENDDHPDGLVEIAA